MHRKVKLPKAVDVAKIRAAAGLSQSEFADLLGLSVFTIQGWEGGKREPTGAAQVLLQVAKHQPEAIKKALAAAKTIK